MEIYVLIGLLMVFLIGVGFLKYRNGYPVNCWFCNYNSKVPFGDRNSFICKSCKQYNGFNRDGSYNRVIEAQHDESLNRRFLQSTSSSSQFQRPFLQRSPSNGLCDRCNHIQELRVQQLANFVPIRDFDREIEHFQNEIEKAFRLCDGCNLIAASLKYGDIFEGGRRTLPEERYHQGVKEPQQLNMKRRRSPRRPSKPLEFNYNRLSKTSAVLLVLSIVNLSVFLNLHMLIFKTIFRESSLPQSVIFSNLDSTYKYINQEFIGKYMPKNYAFTVLYLYILGLFVELLDNFNTKREHYLTNLNKAFAWIFLSLATLYIPEHSDVVLYWTELFCLLFLIYVYGLRFVVSKRSKKYKLKRIPTSGRKNVSLQQEQKSLNLSGSSYNTASINTRNLSYSGNSSFNDSFNKSVKQDIDLSKHLNNVNIGTINTNSQRLSPNPFYNIHSRPHSPIYSFCLPSHNIQPTLSEVRNRNLFNQSAPFQNDLRYQNGPRTSPLNHSYQFYSFSNQPFNNSRFASCGDISSVINVQSYQRPENSIGTCASFVQPMSFNFSNTQNKVNYDTRAPSVSQLWSPRPTSPNEFYNALDRTALNNSVYNTSFHRENPTLFTGSSLNLSFGAPHSSQSVFLNPNIQNNASLNNKLQHQDDDDDDASSRESSSSESSGFISNNDFVKCMSQSLPSSRESSPVR